MRTLDYQVRVLDAVDAYLDTLKPEQAKAEKVAALAAANPELGLAPSDFPKAAWDTLYAAGRLPPSRANVPFSPRYDGVGRPVPNVTLKVPTGGGKTWLAVNAVSRIMGRYLGRNTGFVLWIVPNEAIYTQTLKRLKDRQDPYRQVLDRAAAGRVKVMEKTDRLHADDVNANLCVMVLMLQAANRQTQDALRMFRDRGDVHGFFPAEGEQQLHAAMLAATPNLDGYEGLFPMVKDSLGNALRLIRPIVVMDEGQKATSELAYKTLYGFNPIFVLELTATPKDVRATATGPARNANLLVEVMGRELHAEDMIKMPLNLDPRQGTDWHGTLTVALGKLKELAAAADTLRADSGRYIRPIMLVQVERTGKDQRDGVHIHADDVREWLLKSGLDEAEIAIKTAEQNDLNQPENLDLLSPTNRVRVIITKAALQEGWDCPFAYVLCSLAANSNLSGMTQLVGRILRQPHGVKTGMPALDECHVISHRADTAAVVEQIKKGLEQDGLSDLVLSVIGGGDGNQTKVTRKVERRDTFKGVEIYLPKVLVVDGLGARELDYETDILANIDWRGYDAAPIAATIPDTPLAVTRQLQRITLAESGKQAIVGELGQASSELMAFDPAYAVRVISDIVPNPFVGREIIETMLVALRARGFDDEKLGRFASLIIDELRKGLDLERTARAEMLFKSDVASGRVQFRLRLDGNNWRMPHHVDTTEPVNARVLAGQQGLPVDKSVFAPFYEAELNSQEAVVAVMLDGNGAINWWHRNVARVHYGLQGWKRGRIYPDFIFAVQKNGMAKRIVALETKGDHLQNPDTDYKRDVLNYLSKNFDWQNAVEAGQLELENTGDVVECDLILMQDIPTQLPKLLV
ncbi:MAG: DEAD/DEAH box helicase family protein [Loktanella sp.]|nr:DEAD/DEAH box helicase family protein [Loktanella sp.]